MTENNKTPAMQASFVKDALEITKNLGYLLFCLIIIISGLMMFGASFKYHFLFNMTSSEMVYFLLQSGFYIVIVFTIFCYLLSPIGYLVYYLVFNTVSCASLIGKYIIENIKLCGANKELLNWHSYLDLNKTSDNSNGELLKINEIIKIHHYVFGILLAIVITIAYFKFRIMHNEGFLFACFSMCIVFPTIDIAIKSFMKYQTKLIFVITFCIFVCIFGLFFSKTGYYLFEIYLSVTNGLKHNPVIMLDNDCILKNRPIFNQYDPQVINIITNKSEPTSSKYLSVESTYFNKHSQSYSQFLESYSIISSESNVTYINFYSNKLIYLEKKDKTLDLSDCSTVKVLN